MNALDVLRASAKEPAVVSALFDEVGEAAGADRRLGDHVAGLRKELEDGTDLEYRARRVVEAMALALQGSLLVRDAPNAVADAFCASRLGGDGGHAYGTLPPGVDCDAVLERAAPGL